MLKRNLPPVHPGEILREDYIKVRGLTVTEVAKGLGVARANLSAILNQRAGISPEMAVKLSEAFGNTTQFWMNLQKNYEVWHAERKVNRQVIQHFMLPPASFALLDKANSTV
jgi:addiction module HigA family antidote